MLYKHLLITLITFFSLTLYAQDYEPMLKEGAFWDVAVYNLASRNACDYGKVYRYKIESDTVINNKNYKKLVKYKMIGTKYTVYDDIVCYKAPYVVDLSEKTFTNYYLSEDITLKKVYRSWFRDNKDFIESTLYDFTLKKGDRFETSLSWYGKDVLNTYYNTDNKKVYVFSDWSYTEGIGGNQGIITYYLSDYGWRYKLICSGNDENYNNCSSTLNINENTFKNLKIFPNPVNDFLYVQNKENIKVKIFSTRGKLIKEVASKANLTIDISSFSSGLYFIEVSNSTNKETKKIIKL